MSIEEPEFEIVNCVTKHRLVELGTSTTRLTDTEKEKAPFIGNLRIQALITKGKYNHKTFPSVVCRMRKDLADAKDVLVDEAAVYPLQRKYRKPHKDDLEGKAKLLLRQKQIAAEKKIRKCTMKRQSIQATNMLFESGVNLIAGGVSLMGNLEIAYAFVENLSKIMGREYRLVNFKQVNGVATLNLGYMVDTNKFFAVAESRGWAVKEVNEEFIGITWHSYEENGEVKTGEKFTFVIFSTGKVNVVGLHSFDKIGPATVRARKMLAEFRCESSVRDGTHPQYKRDAHTIKEIADQLKSTVHAKRGNGAKNNAAKRHVRKLNVEATTIIRKMHAVKRRHLGAIDEENEDEEEDEYEEEGHAVDRASDETYGLEMLGFGFAQDKASYEELLRDVDI
jgi:TATA-box binding protein (TBP) (component of TFIID and TFIIIB)